MTWMELYLLLKSMAEAKHTSLCDTPAEEVTAVFGDIQYRLDLVESMTQGSLMFIPFMTDVEDTNVD